MSQGVAVHFLIIFRVEKHDNNNVKPSRVYACNIRTVVKCIPVCCRPLPYVEPYCQKNLGCWDRPPDQSASCRRPRCCNKQPTISDIHRSKPDLRNRWSGSVGPSAGHEARRTSLCQIRSIEIYSFFFKCFDLQPDRKYYLRHAARRRRQPPLAI